MNERHNTPLTREQILQINSICLRFERAWQVGQPPTIEAVAAGVDSVLRPSLLQHLAELDIQHRMAQGGVADLDAYLIRWPDLDQKALQAAIEAAQKTGTTSIFGTTNGLALHAESERSVCNVAEFLRRLKVSRLLTDADLQAVSNSVTEETTSPLMGAQLVASRKLTSYQLTCLLEGPGDPLILGEYLVQDLIGRGGMGAVYRAIHRRMKRTVAIKVLRRDIPHADVLAKRFLREVEVAAKLCHPNIVTAYDAGEQDGLNYLVSEFVEGQNLSDLVRQYGPLSLPLAVDIIHQAAKALQYAHGAGVIHRDIKPSNLLLDDAGHVKLLDVGLARLNQTDLSDPDESADLTTTGMIMGTVDYMSPEQAQNTRLADERSDVYSLGCTLYFLITGRAPYGKGTGMERLLAHREQPIPVFRSLSVSIPEEFDDLLKWMMAKQPEARAASMEAVAFRLETLRENEIPDVTLTLGLNDPVSAEECSADSSSLPLPVLPLPVLPLTVIDDEASASAQSVTSSTLICRDSVASSSERDGSEREGEDLSKAIQPEAEAEFPQTEFQETEVLREQQASRRKRSSNASVWSLLWVVIPGVIAVWLAVQFRPDSTNRESDSSTNTTAKGRDGDLLAEVLTEKTEAEVISYRSRWARSLRQEEEQRVSGVVFVFVPRGQFAYGEENESVLVTMEQDYWLSEVEITVGQFRVFAESMGYETVAEREGTGWGKVDGMWVQRRPYCWNNLGECFVNNDMPACSIAYPDAAAYCQWLSSASGRRCRLPTEEEWEYAARCGRRGMWSFGDDQSQLGDHAWTINNSGLELHSVRTKLPNAWGLYDMHGSESEWCWEPSASSGDFSGQGFIRGGGFSSRPEQTRSASRHQTRLNDPTRGAFRVLMER